MDKKELIIKLKEFKNKITEKNKVQKLILFGSQTNGKANKESDIDLIVVGDFKQKQNRKRSPPLYLAWSLDIPVDFLCYTLEEFKQKKKQIGIVKQALAEGIEI